MSLPPHRFGDFVLDPANRRLLRDGIAVALNARYFDALTLLVREHGRLVGKQRFFDEVWAGSIVTDAALTQCIKEVRRALGDDAAAPRFVRTVPGHGYTFIAPVRVGNGDESVVAALPTMAPTASHGEAAAAISTGASANTGSVAVVAPPSSDVRSVVGADADHTRHVASALASGALADVAAAAAGGSLAGLLGGLLYGSALAVSPHAQGPGTLSVLLVMLALSLGVGMLGALGVGVGLSAARLLGRAPVWTLVGGALGGLVVGGFAKLLGTDVFSLLTGRAPADITGGFEGAVIGFAVAAGVVLGGDGSTMPSRARPALAAAITTGVAGAMLPFAGGSLMATSLASVAAAFDQSRLNVSPLGGLFGEPQFGAFAQAALGALEGGIFGGCVVAALAWKRAREHARVGR